MILILIILLLIQLQCQCFYHKYCNNHNNYRSKVSFTMINEYNSKNIYTITKNGEYKGTAVTIDKMNLLDLHHVVQLSANQFRNRCKDEFDVFQLKIECLFLFLPKLLFPSLMGHSLISIRALYNNYKKGVTTPTTIVGFVDVSLQPCDGTLKSLKNLPFFIRKMLYNNDSNNNDNSNKSALQPYLCNLLVRPEYRQLGLGKLLVSECEKQAKLWGYNKLHLHVEKQSSSVLGLYLNMKFDPVNDSNNIIFMKKDLI